MAYQKPGVEISQVQGSATPILNPADLPSVVVGPGYHIQALTNALDSSGDPVVYSGTALATTFSHTNAEFTTITETDVSNKLPIVDLVGISGPVAGKIKHLSGSDYTVSGTGITVVAAIAEGWSDANSKANVNISWRTLREDLDSYRIINSTSEISTKIGEPVSYNPLAHGVLTAMQNSGSAIGAYGVKDPDGANSLPESSDFDAAMDSLLLSEVYACAFMTHHDIEGSMKTKVESASLPTVKKERIAICNQKIPSPGSDQGYHEASEDNDVTAGGVRDQNSAHNSKRLIMTHPDIVYMEELRHVSTLAPDWIEASFADMGTYSDFTAIGAYARFTGTTAVGSKQYYYWDPITATVAAEIDAAGINELLVFAPIPGWAYTAAIAGQSAGQAPEQPFTNLPIAGLSKTLGSQDYYTDAQLNTMAGGGTYIFTQKSPAAPIVSRHQVTTNVSSIAKRELSITRAVDYAAKFVRSGLEPYIGRNNITPAFLKLFNSVLVAQGMFLVRNGVLNDFKVSSVKVEDTAPDTILADIDLLVKYPVNYIKIQLIF